MKHKITFFLTVFTYLFYTVSVFYTWSLCINSPDEYRSTTLTVSIIGTSIVMTYAISKCINIFDTEIDLGDVDLIATANLCLWDVISLIFVSSMEFKNYDLIRFQLLIIWGNVITLALALFNLIISTKVYHNNNKPGVVELGSNDINVSDSEDSDSSERSSLIRTKSSSTQ